MNSSKKYDNKKSKHRGSCYYYGKVGDYKPNCPLIMKDKEKGHHKKYSKSRRAYIAWESQCVSSSNESSSSSDESAKL